MPVLKKALVVAISSTLLHGCLSFELGDDENDSNDSSTAAATKSFSGKVADGYLTGARVCLDLNSNKVCDPDEPVTISQAGGEFSLEGVTQAQLDSSPLLVEIIVGETIDEDKPDTPIEKKYTLTAPAGYEFISPLTTMVQNEIEENDLSPEDAEGAIQAKLGTQLNLQDDYVAGAHDGTENADEFKRLHKVAQVTVVVLQENIELVEEVLGGNEVSFEDLVAIIVKEVVTSLDTITEQVDTAIETEAGGGDAFDPSVLAQSEELDVAEVDTTTIREEIVERETARKAAAANIAQVLESGQGIHFFDADREFDFDSQKEVVEYYYGTVMKDAASALVSISETFYQPLTSLWQSEMNDVPTTEGAGQGEGESHHDGRICLLSNGTVNCIADDEESISIVGDSVIVEMGGVEATRQEITGFSVDLSGKNILTFMEHEYYRVMDPSAAFTAGTTGYQLSFKRPNALYAVFDQNVESVSQCWDGHIQEHANGAWTPTDTLCNNVFIRTGDGQHDTDGLAAINLTDLTTDTAAIDPMDASDIKGVAVGGRDGFEIIAEFVTGGTVNYYLFKHPYHDSAMNDGMTNDTQNQDPHTQQPPIVQEESLLETMAEGPIDEQPTLNESMDQPMLEVVVSAQWKQTTVAGQTIIEYGIPALLAEMGNVHNEERSRFFVAYQGAVRQGGIQPIGEESDKQWVFDDAGRDQIKAAFDYSLSTPLDPCTLGDMDFDEGNLEQRPGASYEQFKEIATTECNAITFAAADLEGKTLLTDFGFLSFHSGGTGTFLGEVGHEDKAVLDFSWVINADGFLVVNAQKTFEQPMISGDVATGEMETQDPSTLAELEHVTVTDFLRLTLAKIDENARQISIKSFDQQALSATELETVNGAIQGKVWGLK